MFRYDKIKANPAEIFSPNFVISFWHFGEGGVPGKRILRWEGKMELFQFLVSDVEERFIYNIHFDCFLI